MGSEQSNLLELAHQTVKQRRLSAKTETAYVNHIRRFLEFHKNDDMSVKRAEKISVFLRHLQKDEHLAAPTRNQARCALLFLYRDVLGQKLPRHFDRIERARVPGKRPVIFTPEEVKAVLDKMRDAAYLVAALIYGSGLRLTEAVKLRVRDIDFDAGEIVVRDPRTAAKDRATVLPKAIITKLRRHLIMVKFTNEDDCLSGFGKVFLPEKIFRETPDVAGVWEWHYVFPSAKLSTAKNGVTWRHHLAESTVQKAVTAAIENADIFKHGCCQSLRYSFAAHLFEQNHDVHTIQSLLGHKNLKTTMSYLTVGVGTGNNLLSPLDFTVQTAKV